MKRPSCTILALALAFAANACYFSSTLDCPANNRASCPNGNAGIATCVKVTPSYNSNHTNRNGNETGHTGYLKYDAVCTYSCSRIVNGNTEFCGEDTNSIINQYKPNTDTPVCPVPTT